MAHANILYHNYALEIDIGNYLAHKIVAHKIVSLQNNKSFILRIIAVLFRRLVNASTRPEPNCLLGQSPSPLRSKKVHVWHFFLHLFPRQCIFRRTN